MKLTRLLFSLALLAGNACAETPQYIDGLVIKGLASGNVASKAQALELQGEEDVGLGLFRTGKANRETEAFIAYWAFDADGFLRKTMSLSNTWGDTSHLNGFAINRYNAAYIKDGIGRDDLSIRQFGGIGIGLFTITDDDAPNAVGDHLTKLLIRGNTSIYKHDNSITSALTVRNTHNGSGAVLRTRFGNDAREDAFTIDVHASNNHIAPKSVQLINHQNAPLVLGINSKSSMSLEPAGGGPHYLSKLEIRTIPLQEIFVPIPSCGSALT